MSTWISADGKTKVTTISTVDRGSWYQIKTRGLIGWIVKAEVVKASEIGDYVDVDTLRCTD